MSYEILGSKGQYWTCQQGAWSDYLKLATAFGWAPGGAFFRDDERGFGPHDSGSYLGNDWQQVGDDDARRSVTTNAVLLEPRLDELLSAQITGFQITLEGVSSVHD